MSKFYRDLDEYEERMHLEGRCICCGISMGGARFECPACWKLRQRDDLSRHEYRHADFGHEIAKRLGVSLKDGDLTGFAREAREEDE